MPISCLNSAHDILQNFFFYKGIFVADVLLYFKVIRFFTLQLSTEERIYILQNWVLNDKYSTV